jgi:hypothetical protein
MFGSTYLKNPTHSVKIMFDKTKSYTQIKINLRVKINFNEEALSILIRLKCSFDPQTFTIVRFWLPKFQSLDFNPLSFTIARF